MIPVMFVSFSPDRSHRYPQTTARRHRYSRRTTRWMQAVQAITGRRGRRTLTVAASIFSTLSFSDTYQLYLAVQPLLQCMRHTGTSLFVSDVRFLKILMLACPLARSFRSLLHHRTVHLQLKLVTRLVHRIASYAPVEERWSR